MTLKALLLFSLLALCSCKNSDRRIEERPDSLDVQTGLASFYGAAFEGEETASGRIFDPDHFVAAHPHYPLGTTVRVTNLKNGRFVDVRVIDRGPTRPNRREGVIIDLSRKAAETLGFVNDGRVDVRTEVLTWGSGKRVR